MAQEDVFKKIVSHCKEYGFVFPSSELYDGLVFFPEPGLCFYRNDRCSYGWKSFPLAGRYICI